MTKAERALMRDCFPISKLTTQLLTALDEKDVLIADLLHYLGRVMWTNAEAANIEKLKARAEK
jgi:hypothetical protein